MYFIVSLSIIAVLNVVIGKLLWQAQQLAHGQFLLLIITLLSIDVVLEFFLLRLLRSDWLPFSDHGGSCLNLCFLVSLACLFELHGKLISAGEHFSFLREPLPHFLTFSSLAQLLFNQFSDSIDRLCFILGQIFGYLITAEIDSERIRAESTRPTDTVD